MTLHAWGHCLLIKFPYKSGSVKSVAQLYTGVGIGFLAIHIVGIGHAVLGLKTQAGIQPFSMIAHAGFAVEHPAKSLSAGYAAFVAVSEVFVEIQVVRGKAHQRYVDAFSKDQVGSYTWREAHRQRAKHACIVYAVVIGLLLAGDQCRVSGELIVIYAGFEQEACVTSDLTLGKSKRGDVGIFFPVKVMQDLKLIFFVLHIGSLPVLGGGLRVAGLDDVCEALNADVLELKCISGARELDGGRAVAARGIVGMRV